ncbi:hypothetical protein [Pseudomonas putida]|uniref:Norphogenetic protein n=1 Tax=Pseudomonas putida TaxID=303 RepID=A0A1X0ZMB4_PSEPU|nr:hypothetical protein [Pseudomonas putida]ORL58111.1 hypothetical protein B7H17_26315 [Pseudomonas putida]
MIEKIWEGRAVACVASGPSLTPGDCETIESARLPTVAVNSSWKAARFCEVIYAGDLAWWDGYGSEIDIDAERWTCTRQAARKHAINHHPVYGAYNSGMRAIQFAVARGASSIVLLGYDCSLSNGIHWHGEHDKSKNPDAGKVAAWFGQFAVAAGEARSAGCRVMNCSRETALTCFERASLHDALVSCLGG